MSGNNPNPKKSKIVSLFITFAILFIVVFALGIIIGKSLGNSDAPKVERSYEIGVSDEELESEMVEEEVVEEPAEVITKEVEVSKDKNSERVEDESIKAETQVEGTYHIETRKEVSKSDKKADKPKTDSAEEVIKEIKEASLKKTPPKEQGSSADKMAMPKIDAGGRYTVQLGAFQNQNQANGLMNSMKSKGYPAFVKQFETPDKKIWYRVRVGTFSTKERAAEYGDKLKKQQPQVKSVFITTNH